MTKYISTRGNGGLRSYSDVLLEGLAPDGGLFVPDEYPQLTYEQLVTLSGLVDDYPRLFVAVKSLFVGDSIPLDDQQKLANAAYTSERFPAVKGNKFVPVRQVESNLFIQNLSLGPTAAFKDMAMQALGQDMQYELSRRKEQLRILGATSGDTGSSAEAALRGLQNVTLFMLSPQEGMSEFQRAQMAQLSGGNIYNIAVDGRFDDCQEMVKDIKADPEFAHLGAVNSINWARIASQIPYYFSGYFQTIRAAESKNIGDEVDFVIPSGNMGNALSTYIARKMGLPIRNIIVATNENDVLHRLIQTGNYVDKGASITSSPSMDISKASNYERIVYDLFGSEFVVRYMEKLSRDKAVSFGDIDEKLQDFRLTDVGFRSGASTHQDRLDSIKWLHQLNGEVIDPHTADSLTIARKQPLDVPTICTETALAVKFERTIEEALGFVPEREARFKDIEASLQGDNRFTIMGNDIAALKDFIRTSSRDTSV